MGRMQAINCLLEVQMHSPSAPQRVWQTTVLFLETQYHHASASTEGASHDAHVWMCRAGEDQRRDPEPMVP